jgi:hypothetical protein
LNLQRFQAHATFPADLDEYGELNCVSSMAMVLSRQPALVVQIAKLLQLVWQASQLIELRVSVVHGKM